MLRVNLFLLVVLVASALYLVRVQYESRRLYVEIEKTQATPLRVEKLAKEKLQMRAATPAITQYVNRGGKS